MQKPKVFPIVITAVIAASVLFGGWALYNQLAVTAPLSEALKDVPGVIHADKPSINKEEVNIAVKLSEDASLREVYESIIHNGKDVIGSRSVKLNIVASVNDELDELWYQSMFNVAEAMETKAYSQIPEAMNELAERHEGVTAATEMDETNIYITLKKDQATKYIILPRTPVKLGAWANA